MNLLEIRQHAIKLSGRMDLATTQIDEHDVDNGMDFYIRSGSRALDLNQENKTTMSWFQLTMAVGAYIVPIRHCRYVENVWVTNPDEEEVELYKFSMGALTDKYPKLGATNVGFPVEYAIYPIVRPPDQAAYGFPLNYSGIIFMPPLQKETVVKIYGKFHSLELRNNTDENYWSSEYPELLIAASLKELESFYRNREGAADYDAIVQGKLIGIDKDTAAQDASGSLVMEG